MHYKINLSLQPSTFLQFESLCYQNIFLTKIVKSGRYLQVKSSLITKEKRGYEIFKFTVKLQKMLAFFQLHEASLASPEAIQVNKSWYKKCLFVFQFLGFYIHFHNPTCSSKRGRKSRKTSVTIGGVLVEVRNLDLMNMKQKCTQSSMAFYE